MAIANVLQLKAARATPGLSRLNYDAMPSLKPLNLSIAVLERFYCWYITYAVTLTFDPVTLTSALWPWTFSAYRVWRDETLYQIWTQSSIFSWPTKLTILFSLSRYFNTNMASRKKQSLSCRKPVTRPRKAVWISLDKPRKRDLILYDARCWCLQR